MVQDIECHNCGSVNDYRIESSTGLHRTAYCNGCDRYIKHMPKDDKQHVIYFGKFKGTALKDFTSKEHVSWLNWAVQNIESMKPVLKEAILKHLSGF